MVQMDVENKDLRLDIDIYDDLGSPSLCLALAASAKAVYERTRPGPTRMTLRRSAAGDWLLTLTIPGCFVSTSLARGDQNAEGVARTMLDVIQARHPAGSG
jgi:hypothetical protein